MISEHKFLRSLLHQLEECGLEDTYLNDIVKCRRIVEIRLSELKTYNWKNIKVALPGKEMEDSTSMDFNTSEIDALKESLPEGVAFIQEKHVRREDIKPVLDTDGSVKALSYIHADGREFQSAHIAVGLEKIGEPFKLSETGLRWHKEGFATAIENFLINESGK